MVKTKNKSWHNQQATLAQSPEIYATSKFQKYHIRQDRDVDYLFTLHQHPYVEKLIQRLLRSGTAGLQASDTEYHTRVRLENSANATAAGGATVQIPGNEVVYLLDGTHADLNGTGIRFTGPKTARADGQSDTEINVDQEIILAASTRIMRQNKSTLSLNQNTKVSAVDGGPTQIFYDHIFSATRYAPTEMVSDPWPAKELDFSSNGAYANYNWELFFHVPLTMALHLGKNNRFAEAQRWLHFLFDPTDDSQGPSPERFWKVKPFQVTDVRKIEEVLVNLTTGTDEKLRNETIQSIEAWKDAPFRPHVIARYRHQAYMYKTVMAYLDNLVAWGDSLFRQDTGEAIDEAMQLYVLAANILGRRPQAVPKKGKLRPQTYANLKNDLKQFGTVLRDMEADIPFDLAPDPVKGNDNQRLATLRSLGKALYFCVPRNEKLLSYWDTVADRLFKIRNSLNFKGVFRQLALFEPPIDPGMLARAAAAGLDIGAIVNGVNQPLPLVRFRLLLQKSIEIVDEVKSLGKELLAAIEKHDNEALAILRAKHERSTADMMEQVRYGQLQEASKNREALQRSLAGALARYSFFERQLGKTDAEIEESLPQLDELDTASLQKMKFAMTEPTLEPRTIKTNIAQDLTESGGHVINSHERNEFTSLNAAQDAQDSAANLNMIAKFLSLIPELGGQGQPMGVGVAIQFGGRALSTQLSMAADGDLASAGYSTYRANKTSRIGAYERREQEWEYQSNVAAGEINQIFTQLRSAQIREAIAEHELTVQRKQMQQAEDVELFLNEEGNQPQGKTANKSLYAWMKRDTKALYSRCFQFAFDVSKKAERALQYEMGDSQQNFIQFDYLSGKEGLLAGEKLSLDLKRMEMTYHDMNQREYELTRHVSLLQLDPLALIQLRKTGRCSLTVPEELFDLDGPGHYFRRIRQVAVSIPCITGPYASVNCTLTLTRSSIRTRPELQNGGYPKTDAEDSRFSDNFGSSRSIVTSSARNDSGMFEGGLNEERYLPFEYAGAISQWELQLPANPANDDPMQFDYDSISDVILHIRYTAREGGVSLKSGATANIKQKISDAMAPGSTRLFSVRHEFPNEWAKFINQVPVNGNRFELALGFREAHFPFWTQGRLNGVSTLAVIAESNESPIPGKLSLADKAAPNDDTANVDDLVKDSTIGNLLFGKLTNIPRPDTPVTDQTLFFENNNLTNLWLAMTFHD